MERPMRIGALTIGQTPRDDVVVPLRQSLGRCVEIVEAGALDGLSREEIESLTADQGGALLVTRLRDGGEVRVREALLSDRLQQALARLQDRVQLIAFLCTGDFPRLSASVPVLQPGPMLRCLARTLGLDRLGVLTPADQQIPSQRERWRGVAREVVVEAASPYGPREELRRAASRLRQAEVDTAVMDCIGYTLEMKRTLHRVIRQPVMSAASVLAHVARELLD